MNVPFEKFEENVNHEILDRGLDYYENGYVQEPEEIADGMFQAIVKGTDNYLVTVQIEEGNIIRHSCDCPYDMGPACKHVIALLYYLQHKGFSTSTGKSTEEAQAKKRIPKRKTLSEQLDEILLAVPEKDLRNFIKEKAINSPAFRNSFISSFAHYNSQESVDIYKKRVNGILKKAGGRHGYIDYYSAGQVSKEVNDLLHVAQNHIEHCNYKSAVFICIAVMEKMTEALDFSDDSDGSIGDCIHNAYNMLFSFSREKIDEKNRKFLFNYCLSAVKQRIYSGWDWHFDILDLASQLSNSKKEAMTILDLIENESFSEWEWEHAQWIQYTLLNQLNRKDEALQYLQANIGNPVFRREAISNAMKKEDYQTAITIARDGIEYDQKEKPGLAKEWYDWLLKIAQAQDDKEKIIEYARFLLIDSFRNDQDYYAVLKQTVPSGEWVDIIESIVREIIESSRWVPIDQLANIYIREQWWDRMLGLIRENPSLYTIDEYAEYLANDYAEDLIDLYITGIENLIQEKTGRKFYRAACRYIKKIEKLGGP